MPLIGILLSAVWTAMSFVFRAVLIKFVVFTACFLLLTELIPIVINLVGSHSLHTGSITGAFANISPSVWYFLNAFRFDVGVPMILSAYGTRFVIRRIPFIG